MVTCCTGDIVDALDRVSAIQCDSSSEESDSDISNIQIIEESEDR